MREQCAHPALPAQATPQALGGLDSRTSRWSQRQRQPSRSEARSSTLGDCGPSLQRTSLHSRLSSPLGVSARSS